MSACSSSNEQELLDDIARDQSGREERRPPKRNNVKRDFGPAAKRTKVECRTCKSSTAIKYDSDSHEFVCTDCGNVAGGELDVGYDDFRRVRAGRSTDARRNYLHERLSQLLCAEPAIEDADLRRLREAHANGCYSPLLDKYTVRAIICDAGLSPKKYTEKWLSIRIELGAEPHPVPDGDLLLHVKYMYSCVCSLWLRRPDLHPGRKSLPSYNFMMRQFYLSHSLEAFITHAPWLPLPTEKKTAALTDLWRRICRELDWPDYRVVCDENGELKRITEPVQLPITKFLTEK